MHRQKHFDLRASQLLVHERDKIIDGSFFINAHDVIAELASNQFFSKFSGAEREDRLLKLRHHVSSPKPSKIAALVLGGIGTELGGKRREVLPFFYPFENRLRLSFHRIFIVIFSNCE